MRVGSCAVDVAVPARPYLPPSAAGAAGMAISCACSLELAWRMRSPDGWGICEQYVFWWLAAVAGVVLCVAAVARLAARGNGRGMCARWFAGGLMVGFMAGFCWACSWTVQARRLCDASQSNVLLSFVGDATSSAFGYSASADVLSLQTGAKVARVRCTMSSEPRAASSVRAVFRMKPLGQDEWGRSRFMKGECASLQVVHSDQAVASRSDIVARLRAALLRSVDPGRDESRALVAGVVCGRTTELNQTEANAAFSTCGLTHLVAVSGSHLAYISVLLQAILIRTRAPRRLRFLCILICMGVYVVFSGGAPSAVRSVVMVSLSMGAMSLGRRGHPLSGWSLAAMVLLAVNPGIVFDLGFQLSAMSVLFILLFCDYVAYALTCLRVPSIVREPLAMTLVAQWATLPLTLPTFGTFSVVSPLANLVVGPLMTALLAVGLVSVPLSALTPLGQLALWPATALSRASIFCARVCAQVPYASVNVLASGALLAIPYLCAVLLYVFWPAVRAVRLSAFAVGGFIAGCIWIVRWGCFAPPSVTVMDVGQGDSILIRDGASTLLVDAGIDEATAEALARNHVFRLDGAVVTHWDRDHWGGLPSVLDGVPVSNLIVARGAAANAPKEVAGEDTLGIEEMAAGDRIQVGGFVCTAVWPDCMVGGEENGDSLCLLVEYEQGARHMSMLLTGDVECEEASEFAGVVGDIDVLKLGHHGSKVSVSDEVMDVLKPEVSIASAGEGNRYGHPTEACIEIVERSGSRFVCTKDVGDVVVAPGVDGAEVTCVHSSG